MNIGKPLRVYEADPNTAPATVEVEEEHNEQDLTEIEKLLRELEEPVEQPA